MELTPPLLNLVGAALLLSGLASDMTSTVMATKGKSSTLVLAAGLVTAIEGLVLIFVQKVVITF